MAKKISKGFRIAMRSPLFRASETSPHWYGWSLGPNPFYAGFFFVRFGRNSFPPKWLNSFPKRWNSFPKWQNSFPRTQKVTFLVIFIVFLYYLHQTLTQNVQKSYNIGQILSKKAETHFQSIKTFFKRLKLIFKMPKLISKMPKLISQKAKTHFRGISLECPRLDCAQKKACFMASLIQTRSQGWS